MCTTCSFITLPNTYTLPVLSSLLCHSTFYRTTNAITYCVTLSLRYSLQYHVTNIVTLPIILLLNLRLTRLLYLSHYSTDYSIAALTILSTNRYYAKTRPFAVPTLPLLADRYSPLHPLIRHPTSSHVHLLSCTLLQPIHAILRLPTLHPSYT